MSVFEVIRVFPKIRGTPKWMVYNGKPIKMDDLGVPLFSETSIQLRVILRFKRHIPKRFKQVQPICFEGIIYIYPFQPYMASLCCQCCLQFTERTAVGQILFTQEVIGAFFFSPKHTFFFRHVAFKLSLDSLSFGIWNQ